MKKYKNKLFTLMEILAVLAIITILTTITVGVYGLILDTSNNNKTEMTIKSISAAMQNYKIDIGYYGAWVFNGSNGNADFNDLRYNWAVIKDPNINSIVINKTDSTFIKYFSYETFKGNGIIKNSKYLSYTYSYFTDAWGRPIIYKYPGKVNTTLFDIGSLGKDGRYGDNSSDSAKFGEGDDITNFNR